MPLVKTLIATRARKVVLAAATAGSVFTLFTLVGVGAATGLLTGSFETGESILEATYGSERVAVSAVHDPRRATELRKAAVEKNVDAANRPRSKGSPPATKPGAPLPGAPGQPAAPPADARPQGGAAPSPTAPSAPTLETPSVPVPVTPPPPVTTPTLPTPPALPQVPEVPNVPVPAVAGVLP